MAETPGETGGGGQNPGLEDLAAQLQQAAADRRIKELDPNYRVSDSAEEARSAAEYQTGVSGGKARCNDQGGWETVIDDEIVATYWPRDSAGYQNVLDGYADLRTEVEGFTQFDPSGLTMAIGYLDEAATGLDQGGDLTAHAEEIADASLVDEDSTRETFEECVTDNSSWYGAAEVADWLSHWTGRASEMFRLTYVNRLPAILVGQLALAKVLKESLEIEQAALTGTKQDAQDIAQAGIDAFDGLEGNVDADWTGILNTIEEVAGLVGAATSLVPVPSAQAINKAAGYIATGAGLAKKVVAEVEGHSGGEKVEVDGNTADEIASSVMSALWSAKVALQDVERSTADVLDEFYAMVTSTEDAVKVFPKRDNDLGYVLTVRESYFEPRTPGKESGYGPGLTTIAKRNTDDDPDNDLGYEDVRDPQVFAAPPATGEAFAADLEGLAIAGSKILPTLAGQYDSVATSVSQGDVGVERSLTHDLAGGQGTTTGALFPSWNTLYEEFLAILSGSATNLNLAGEALVMIGGAYAEQDDAAAAELKNRMNEADIPWPHD